MDERKGKCLEATEDAQNGPNECAICLSDLQGNFMVLPCHATHAFHNDSIKQWVNRQGPNLGRYWRKICCLYKKLPCPICRETFRPNDLDLISDYYWTPTLG
ncbi:hypothetical protein [Candidatus Cardinium sp. TP]|uniref:hypothetical protein n=1 Tax=Candidatus Cardinium sp. TP TaxID=2961955 RepID=UPI0021AE4733|nr:hypothetical protein [Candidatus Cardinium sp. TP]MCT4697045.1 hypothetical protein [Candidatus Cardinium sp. TP]MDN5246661.1 hypothetical protein [Candidatus Cardinium sp.]